MTDSVVVPAHITLRVAGGGLYELQGLQITYQANGVNVALCTLAVGRSETNDLVNLDIDQGAEMEIVFQSTFGEEVSSTTGNAGIPIAGEENFGVLIRDNKPFKLFQGFVDDWGPTTIRSGAFAVQVRCFGRLAALASGTIQTSSIIPNSYMDTLVSYPFGQGREDPGFINIREALGSNGFWPSLQGALQRVAATAPTQADISSSSITAEVWDNFGIDVNGAALQTFPDIQGQMPWRGPVIPSVPGIIYHLNEQLRSNWFYGSFLQAILQLGEQLKFSIIEHGEGIAVVPHHPFWARNISQGRIAELRPNSWDSFQWVLEGYNSYAGSVLVLSNGQEPAIPGSGEDLVIGLGKVPGFELGRVHVGPAPGFMASATAAMEEGLSDEARATGGPAVARAAFGDTYALLQALDLNFQKRRCRVTSPALRTDLGLLRATVVRFPDIPEITSGSDTSQFGVYGTIQAVTLAIDAARGHASTTFDISHVRSLNQQSQIIDALTPPHPFFASNYTGGRLDQDPFIPEITVGF